MQVLSCAPAQVRDSFSHYEGGISPRLGYGPIREDQRKRLMGTTFPLAEPSISGQLPGSHRKCVEAGANVADYVVLGTLPRLHALGILD
jgi:hypothetical protein